MGCAGFSPGSGARDEPLRRQHLLRRARAVGRLDADHRRGDGHPQPRRRDREGAAEDQHPAHPPPSRPHPGADVLRPCFRSESQITIWGPSSPEASLEERIARYISAPLSPVEVRELPCDVNFRDTPATEWEIGPAKIRAEAVTHRGPTLGYRVTDGDTSLTYISDHEPGARRRPRDPRARVDLWIRPRSRRRSADPRLPVHGQRVPRARRLGPLEAHRHPHLRAPGRGPAPDALPPRPAALR